MEPETGFLGAWSATCSAESRDVNEDAYVLRALGGDGKTMLAAVADGMGGHLAGEVASRLALHTLSRKLDGAEDFGSETDMGHILQDAVAKANEEVLRAARSRGEWKGMGTTLTAALVADHAFAICHVGDSRAYWYSRHFSDLVILTRDHSLSAEASGDPSSTSGGVLTRALGVTESLNIDSSHGLAKTGDRLLLCTDGVTRSLDRNDIHEVMAGDDPRMIPESLVGLAKARGSRDDATAVLLAWMDIGEEKDLDR